MGIVGVRMAGRTVCRPSRHDRHHSQLRSTLAMFLPVPPQRSCARAWVEASLAVIQAGDEGYSVIIEVVDPVNHDPQDVEVIKFVNSFLRHRGDDNSPYPLFLTPSSLNSSFRPTHPPSS